MWYQRHLLPLLCYILEIKAKKMETFKISIFEKELRQKFPMFETLSIERSKAIIEKLSQLFRLNISDFMKVQEAGQYVANIDATTKDFSPSILFPPLQQPTNILVIWNYESPIDVFRYQDFCRYFEYIWYQSADDILIINELLKVLFLIRHDGIIYQVSLPKE